MKKFLKVMAVISLVASMVFICCGCSEQKKETRTMSEVFELSDPNEHTIKEDMWYESILRVPRW